MSWSYRKLRSVRSPATGRVQVIVRGVREMRRRQSEGEDKEAKRGIKKIQQLSPFTKWKKERGRELLKHAQTRHIGYIVLGHKARQSGCSFSTCRATAFWTELDKLRVWGKNHFQYVTLFNKTEMKPRWRKATRTLFMKNVVLIWESWHQLYHWLQINAHRGLIYLH